MTTNGSKLERLNAYVDGELPLRDAALVAEEVASNPEYGRIVAKLHSLKSSVAASFHTPAKVAAIQNGRPKYGPALRSTAAIVALALIAGALWYGSKFHSGKGLLSAALLKHDSWVADSEGRIILAKIPSGLVIPDLTPAGLKLLAFEPDIKLGNIPAARLAYVGRRGCQLSLFVMRGRPDLFSPQQGNSDGLVERWTFRDHSFLLVSRNMNKTRFNVIADALKSATSHSVPIDERMRVALSAARQRCRA